MVLKLQIKTLVKPNLPSQKKLLPHSLLTSAHLNINCKRCHALIRSDVASRHGFTSFGGAGSSATRLCEPQYQAKASARANPGRIRLKTEQHHWDTETIPI